MFTQDTSELILLLLLLLLHSVKKGDRSLRSFGPIVWNTMLPEELKVCQGLDEFKDSIKSWVPENCPCELCKTYIAGLVILLFVSDVI